VAWPLQVLALALAPITVVQPLLSTTVLVLLAVARVKLHERVGMREAAGALAIVVGLGAVVWAAPRHTVRDPEALRVAVPLLVVGLGAVCAYLAARMRPRAQLSLVVGAGLAYAWVDFVNKLLADALSSGRWILAIIWLAATVAMGGLAFLEETTDLQRRPAVTVAPVIGAVHDPLPVLMALAARVEVWGSAPHLVGLLIGGLALIATGAGILGGSKAVARVSGDPETAAGTLRRLAASAPDRYARPSVGPPEEESSPSHVD
jgi:drug/metabolite transporter (DMT)-like permease